MKKISIYTQGGQQAAGMYYRFYQYFDSMDFEIEYHQQLSDKMYKMFMPISQQNIVIKVCLFIYISIRVTVYLIKDVLFLPYVLIVSRTFVNKYFFSTHRFLLRKIIKKGCRIIWDFDDNIIALGEINKKNVLFMSQHSYAIVVASPYLVELIPDEYKSKIHIIPTTDGTINKRVNDFKNIRSASFCESINILWVGTFSGLVYLKDILPQIELAGKNLQSKGKQLVLNVVCNQHIDYCPNYFKLNNIIWSRDAATECFLKNHIGIMPLHNTVIEQGKGGFKLIQYLSAGLPSIASAVGINNEILSHGGGVLIKDLRSDQWSDEITRLSIDKDYWQKQSDAAENNYMKFYSYQQNLNAWMDLLK